MDCMFPGISDDTPREWVQTPLEFPLTPTERERYFNEILTLAEGAELRNVHVDTLKREDQGAAEKRSVRFWCVDQCVYGESAAATRS